MIEHILKLNRLSFRERTVVALMRGEETRKVDERDRPAFAALRAALKAEGFELLSPEAQYFSVDEMYLLGILTMLQRRRPEYAFDASDALREALAACSRKLVELGMLLDRRNVTRMPGDRAADHPLNPRPLYATPKTPAAAPRFRAPTPSSLQACALRFVADRGSAHSRALQEFGASRAVIHLMFKRGLLIRSRTGVYEASHDAIMWLEQCKGSSQCSFDQSPPSQPRSRAWLRRSPPLRATP